MKSDRRPSSHVASSDDELVQSHANDAEYGWRVATRIAIIALSFIGLIWFLSWARPILLPIISGILIGMIFGPIADRTKRFGIPTIVTNLAVVTILFAVAYGIAALFIPTLTEWIARAPELAVQVRDKVGFLQRILERLEDFERLLSMSPGQPKVEVDGSPVSTIFAAVTPAFAQFVVFIFTLVFFMVGRNSIKHRLVLAVHGRENRLTVLRILADVESRLLGHFATITVINLGVALLTTLMLWTLGVPSAPVWGFLAFALNYLPVVGPLVLKALLLGMGILVMPTVTAALLPVLGYLVITTVESNLFTPRVFGRRLTVEPLWIFVTICFLTWLWGPVGALLSMPILSIAIIVADHLSGDDVVLPG